jgi:hypothetical protein
MAPGNRMRHQRKEKNCKILEWVVEELLRTIKISGVVVFFFNSKI